MGRLRPRKKALKRGVLGEERVTLGRSLPSGPQVPCLYHVDIVLIAPMSPPASHPMTLVAGLLTAPSPFPDRACAQVE